MIVFSGFLALISCSTHKEATSPPVDTPESFSESGTAVIPDKWWTAFGDEKLNALVDSAMQSNFDLLTAWERLRAANAVSDLESSALFPSLEATAGGEINRFSDNSQSSEQIQLGLSSAYEIDLWGRIRSSIEAEQYRAQATLLDYQTG